MKKLILFLLLITHISCALGADSTPVPTASVVSGQPAVVALALPNPVTSEMADLVQLARKAAIKENELRPKTDTPQEDQETAKDLLKKMRVCAKGLVVSGTQNLTQVYTKAHELAVKNDDAQAAQILALEKMESERGFYHSWKSAYAKSMTFLEFLVPAVLTVGVAVGVRAAVRVNENARWARDNNRQQQQNEASGGPGASSGGGSGSQAPSQQQQSSGSGVGRSSSGAQNSGSGSGHNSGSGGSFEMPQSPGVRPADHLSSGGIPSTVEDSSGYSTSTSTSSN